MFRFPAALLFTLAMSALPIAALEPPAAPAHPAPLAPSPAPVAGRVSAEAAFERLKSLAGDWRGTVEGEAGSDVTVSYRITANGSALVERLVPGPHHGFDMTTVYFQEGDELRLIHFCAMLSQPHMRLDLARSRPDELFFQFDGGTNLDPAKDMHMHEGRLQVVSADRIVVDWTTYQGGRPRTTERYFLSRTK